MRWFSFRVLSDNPPKSTDCFVIISYAVKDKFQLTRITKKVIDLAYKWWKKFPNAQLIVSTGDNQNLGVPNSEVMKKYAISLGIPKEKIIEEDKSLDAYENLLYSRKIIEREGFKKPTLVALDLHSRRAVALAKKQGWEDFYWISVYSKGGSAYGYKKFQTCSRVTMFIYEILACFYNKFRGQL